MVHLFSQHDTPSSMFKKQGDVPRQLGWSAADHWGLAPWMASHGGSGTHIGFPKSLRLHTWKVGQDELAKFMGDTSWQRTVARKQCLHENRCETYVLMKV